ncbi:MAG: hypothetical protein JXA24_06750, partial [Proteobacteria bacterium]|nr:hypothetical protein [Pseudomonadota bacterium]
TATVDTSTYFIVPTPAAAAAQTKAAIDDMICDPTAALAAAVSCPNFTQCMLDPAQDLAGGTSYTICLTTAIEYLGGSSLSTEKQLGSFEGFMATFTTTGSAPGAPANLAAEIGPAGQQLILSWDPVEGAASYNLYWATAEGVTPATGTKIEGVTSPYTHDGLTNGTLHYYVATAVSDSLESGASNEASGLPQINPVGTLDSAFNGVGYANWGASWDWGEGVAIDSEGRIVVGGTINDGGPNGYDIALWRYNADGTPDTTFNGTGLVTHHGAAGGNKWDNGTGVAIDTSGRYLVSGYSDGADDKYDMVILRYNPDGTLDNTFGTGGIVVYDRGINGNNWGYALTIDSNGMILVAGLTNGTGSDGDMTLWRYNVDGTPDTSFGTGGVVFKSHSTGSGGDEGRGVAVDSSGKIVVVGGGFNGSDNDLVVWRYNSDGTLDTSFSGDGFFVYDGGNGDDGAAAVIADSEDRPVITGYVINASDVDMVAMRFTGAGALDTTFGTNGIVTYDDGKDENGFGISMDSRGRCVMTGETDHVTDPSSMIAVRLTPDGAFDTTFDGDGVVSFQNGAIVDSSDRGTDLTFDDMGRIVITGNTGTYGHGYMMLWRYE